MGDKKIICLAVDDEPPALEVLKKYITSVQHLELAGTCADAIEALSFLQQHPVGQHYAIPRTEDGIWLSAGIIGET